MSEPARMSERMQVDESLAANFSQIWSCTDKDSSLYLTLTMGLFEVFTRFFHYPNLIPDLNQSYANILAEVTNSLIDDYQIQALGRILVAINNLKKPNDSLKMTSCDYLQYYGTDPDSTEIFITSMRLILYHFLSDYRDERNRIFENLMESYEIIIDRFASYFKVCVVLLDKRYNEFKEFPKNKCDGLPVIFLYNHYGVFSLLYPSEFIEAMKDEFYNGAFLGVYPFLYIIGQNEVNNEEQVLENPQVEFKEIKNKVDLEKENEPIGRCKKEGRRPKKKDGYDKPLYLNLNELHRNKKIDDTSQQIKSSPSNDSAIPHGQSGHPSQFKAPDINQNSFFSLPTVNHTQSNPSAWPPNLNAPPILSGLPQNSSNAPYNLGVPPPNLTGPPANFSVSPPNLGGPPPNLAGPSANSGVHPPNLAGPPPNLSAPPPNLGGPPPNLGNAPPNLGNAPPNVSVPPPNLGGPPPNLGNAPPNFNVPPPNLGGPPPNLGNAPPNLGNAPPNLGNAPPNLGVPPQNFGNARPNLGVPPPNFGGPPPNIGNAPLNLGMPPPNLGNAPPNLGVPPPNLGNAPPLAGSQVFAGPPQLNNLPVFPGNPLVEKQVSDKLNGPPPPFIPSVFGAPEINNYQAYGPSVFGQPK